MATAVPSRAERTRQTRRKMLDSARELFVGQGFTETKGRLLIEVVETTAAGSSDPEPVPERPWFHQMLTATSGQRVLALLVEHGTAIYQRVSPLWPAVAAAAATDPEVAEYWQGIAVRRRRAEQTVVTRIAELGQLKHGLDLDPATDLVVVLAGHDPYRGLVLDAGWPISEYRGWLFTTLVHQLLDLQAPDPAATEGLSFHPWGA